MNDDDASYEQKYRVQFTQLCRASAAEGKNPATDPDVQKKIADTLSRDIGGAWIKNICRYQAEAGCGPGAVLDPGHYHDHGRKVAEEALAKVSVRFEKADWRGEKQREMAQASSSKSKEAEAYLSKSKEAEAYREKSEKSTYEAADDIERGEVYPEASSSAALRQPERPQLSRVATENAPPSYEIAMAGRQFPSVPTTELPSAAPAQPEQLPPYSREATPTKDEEEREAQLA